jgi:hypothetical protein
MRNWSAHLLALRYAKRAEKAHSIVQRNRHRAGLAGVIIEKNSTHCKH